MESEGGLGFAGRVAGLESWLAHEILGQADATRQLARAIARGELGCIEPGRPRSFVLLLGETGVGKTESVLSLARHLYPKTDTVVRLDMAEYAERGPGLARLVGSSREDSGLLAAELARARHGREGCDGRVPGLFLLVDEIEKAHPDITRLFLGMEAARLTTADGRVLDLSDTHIVCTSNLGSESARDLSGQVPYAYLRSVVEEEARAHFGSAVFARFSDIIVYRGLDYATQRAICAQKLERKLQFFSSSFGSRFTAAPGVLEHLLRRGYHRDLGARMMRHAIDREMGDAVVRALGAGIAGKNFEFKADDSGLEVRGSLLADYL